MLLYSFPTSRERMMLPLVRTCCPRRPMPDLIGPDEVRSICAEDPEVAGAVYSDVTRHAVRIGQDPVLEFHRREADAGAGAADPHSEGAGSWDRSGVAR